MIKFGTDGWRGVIADDFTFENVRVVSQAIADYLNSLKGKKAKVVVGYDCRFLSREFAETCAEVLAANGIKVCLSNRNVPTPAVSFHALYNHYDLGIMITASHNPAQFNGLKIKTKEGAAADKSLTDRIEALLHRHKYKYISADDAKKRGLVQSADLTTSYVEFLKSFVDLKKIRKLELRILVDTMYGTGDNYIEKVLGKSKIKIDYLHNEFNPSFGGIHPEPIAENVRELIDKVKRYKYDLGVILDGDSDRIALVGSRGNFINAQVILPLLSIHMIKNRKVKGGIGKTVVGSNLIDKVANYLEAACFETPVGFKYISNLFKENLICIGGEEAGGIGFKGYIPERDGSASSLLLLEMLACENKNFNTVLSELYKTYGQWYYRRTAIPLRNFKKDIGDIKLPRNLLGKKIERVNKLDGIKLIIKDGWLMFRKSGTESIVRVYAESKNEKEMNNLLDLGKKMIYDL